MRTILLAALAAVSLAGLAGAAEPDPKVMSYKLPKDIPWQGDPKGAQRYTLWGDPSKPGPYAVLVRWPPHMMSRPHTHPHDRYIMVLKGVWWVGWGQTYDPDSTFPIPAGSNVTHFANQYHYDGAKDEEAILEIVGEGPQ